MNKQQFREKNGRFGVEKNTNKRKKAVEAMLNARAKKRRIEEEPKTDILEGNRIINLHSLAKSLKCKKCATIQDIEKCTEEKCSGLSSTFIVTCTCGTVNSIHTSEIHNKNGKTYADINTLGVLGAVHSGTGHTKFDKLLSCMDIPSIIPKLYKMYETHVGGAIEATAKESCKRAIEEERRLVLQNVEKLYDYLPPEIAAKVYPSVHKLRLCQARNLPDSEFDTALDEFVNVIGLYDMAWSTRGTGRSYDSLNGYGLMFGFLSKKVLTYISLIRICAYCKRRGIEKGHENCRKNFVGSAKSMEAFGALQMLQCSLFEEHKIRVRILVGDDDCTVIDLLNKRIAATIYKLSDRNHVVKNIKKDFYQLAESHKELKKPGVIKYLEKLFSYCVSQNEGKSEELAKVLRCIPDHAFGNHESCQDWCKRKEDSEGQTIVLSGGVLYEKLKALFNKYANNARKFCVMASTQANESTHNMIAHILPKNTCLSRTASADYRVAQAVNIKNDGEACLIPIRSKLQIPATSILTQHIHRIDTAKKKRALIARIKEAKVKRLQRKKDREALRKTNERNEGVTYRSNVGFDNLTDENESKRVTFIPTDHCIVYFDTETTGLHDLDIILQIGAIYNNRNFSIYITPTKDISNDASRVTGLTVKISDDGNIKKKKRAASGDAGQK